MKTHSPPSNSSLGFGIAPQPVRARRRKGGERSAVRTPKILVVDPDSEVRRLTVARLTGANYSVEFVESGKTALDACIRSRPNLVITDLQLPDMDGMSLLTELKSRWPQMVVIVLTTHASISEAVQATQRGAFGFLVKPVGKEELLGQVQRAIAVSTFARSDGNWRVNIVSRSQLMEDRLSIANRAAASDAPLLLTGENGTGKELLARSIHAASARRDKRFISVACGNALEHELELEIFGEEPDESDSPEAGPGGAFQLACGGTLKLDEISELPMRLQVSLARALSNYQVPPGNGRGAARADVRLICTTSRDLEALAKRGEFFRELLDQIGILAIEIPPLGRRREDIPLLVSHFLEQATLPGDQKKMYSPKAIELLATTDWPGNVRQLFDLVKQNVALSHGKKVMSREFVQQSLGSAPAAIPTYEEARDSFSRDYLAANLQSTAGNVTTSARIAKRNRTDFYKLLARHRLHPEDFKNGGAAASRRSAGVGYDDSG